MTGEKMVTEREKVEAERMAYIVGVDMAGMLRRPGVDYWRAKAVGIYPLPKMTRPRTYKEGGFTFRVMDGKIVQQDSGDSTWYTAFHGQLVDGAYDGGCTIGGEIPVTPTLLAALANLLANPTEEVPG